jgi:hypothetical protein
MFFTYPRDWTVNVSVMTINGFHTQRKDVLIVIPLSFLLEHYQFDQMIFFSIEPASVAC